MIASPLRRIAVPDAQVAFDDLGAGEPILLIHAGVFSDWFVPLTHTPALAETRLIRTVRAGYGGLNPPTRPLTIDDHADHLAIVLDAALITKAHVVGHSSGCEVALSFAVRHPRRVASLLLYEPAPAGPLAAIPSMPQFGSAVLGPVLAAAAEGDVAGAYELFMRAAGGEDFVDVLDRSLGPEHRAVGVVESAYFFGGEVPALGGWTLDVDDAVSMHAPVRIALGGASPAVYAEVADRLTQLLPHASRRIVPGGDHLLPLRDPEAFGRLVHDFVTESRT